MVGLRLGKLKVDELPLGVALCRVHCLGDSETALQRGSEKALLVVSQNLFLPSEKCMEIYLSCIN